MALPLKLVGMLPDFLATWYGASLDQSHLCSIYPSFMRVRNDSSLKRGKNLPRVGKMGSDHRIARRMGIRRKTHSLIRRVRGMAIAMATRNLTEGRALNGRKATVIAIKMGVWNT